ISITSANQLAYFLVDGEPLSADKVYEPGHHKLTMTDAGYKALESVGDMKGFLKSDPGFSLVVDEEASADFYVVPSANDTFERSVSLNEDYVEYGTSSDALAGMFTSEVSVSGCKLVFNQDYTVEYKFLDYQKAVSDNILSDNVLQTAKAADLDYTNNSDFDTKKPLEPGQVGVAIARIKVIGMNDSSNNQVYLYAASKPFTITKRKLDFDYNKDEDKAFGGLKRKSPPENMILSANSLDTTLMTIAPENNNYSGVTSIAHANLLSGNMVLDLSAVDFDRAGFYKVPISELGLKDVFYKYFEIGHATGRVYVDGTGTYKVVFHAYEAVSTKDPLKEHLGQVFTLSGNGTTLLSKMGSLADDGKLYPDYIKNYDTLSVNGIYDGKKTRLAGWSVFYVKNGKISATKTVEPGALKDLVVEDEADYTITADIRKYFSDGAKGVYVEPIPDVTYDGRKHLDESLKVYDAGYNTKPKSDDGSNVYDLKLNIYDDSRLGADKKDYKLQYAKDYTVSYKNNINASGVVLEDGVFVPNSTDARKKPCAVIKGKGDYSGFKATVYFNIRPADINIADVSGILDSYNLKKNKLSKAIKCTVMRDLYFTTKGVAKTKTIKLKEAKEYSSSLYKYIEKNGTGSWVKVDKQKKISSYLNGKTGDATQGTYMIRLKGVGNYTGEYMGDFTVNQKPDIYGKPNQFRVIDDQSYDICGAKITFNKRLSVDTTTGTISVKDVIKDVAIKKKVLKFGRDYEARLIYQGEDGNYSRFAKAYDEFGANVPFDMAGKYCVEIRGIEKNGYYGSMLSKSVKVSGLKISNKKSVMALEYTDDTSAGAVWVGVDSKTKIQCSGKGKIRIKAISNDTNLVEGRDFKAYTVWDYDKNTELEGKWASTAANSDEYCFIPKSYDYVVEGMGKYAGTSFKLKYKLAEIDLKNDTSAVTDLKENGGKGLIEIGVPNEYKSVSLNAGGTMPYITIRVNGKYACADYDGKEVNAYKVKGSGQTFTYDENGENMKFTVTITDNSFAGKTGRITVKGTGGLKGILTREFNIVTNNTYGVLPSYDNRDGSLSLAEDDVILADVADELKGSSNKYTTTLYQAYYGKYKNNKPEVLYKKLAIPKGALQAVETVSGAGINDIARIMIKKGTEDKQYKVPDGVYAEELWHSYASKPTIAGVTVSLNSINKDDWVVKLPDNKKQITVTGEDFSVVKGYKYDERGNIIGSIYKMSADGKVMYGHEDGSINTVRGSDGVPLYDDRYCVKLKDGGTVSQNYIITNQKPARCAGSIKFDVQLVKRVPDKIEEYKYGGQFKTFTYKLVKPGEIIL
ncbi:MAG: hypothetical protein K5857_09430, partial [Lachnospiraceae bacterium]|nr:hypothetical protein [Lachnospiraceae bacterium]